MPYSTHEGKAEIAKWINGQINDSDYRIIDLGCGHGTYGRLIKKPCFSVAVDAIDYKDKFGLLDFYDEFHKMDVRETRKLSLLGKFDLAIMGDVLEHLEVTEAQKVLKSLERQCSTILVAVPYMYWQWSKSNPYEIHRQPDLTPETFKERYPEFVLHSIYNRKAPPWNGLPFYGYYIWEGEHESRS
jgi:SAM-dependent methyltransferase